MGFLFHRANSDAGAGGHLFETAAFHFHEPKNLLLAGRQFLNQLFEIEGKFRSGGKNSFIEFDFGPACLFAVTLSADVAGNGIDPGQYGLTGAPGVAAAMDLIPGLLKKVVEIEGRIAIAKNDTQSRGDGHNQLLQRLPFAGLVAAHPVFERNFWC